MKLPTFALFLAVGALAPALAHAQPDEVPSAPPAAAASREGRVAAEGPRCRLGEHAGVEDADASTATRMVCSEIARFGGGSGRYVVALGRLGSIVILSVSREGEAAGTTADSRELRLQGVEEVAVAAPRIAESLVRGTPLVDTEKVDNLVGQEARIPKDRPGATHFAVGIVGLLPPLDRGLTPAPGLDLDLHYETGNRRFELLGAMRFGAGANANNATTVVDGFFALGVGGRYYTSDADISPYLGGGLTWSVLSLNVVDSGFHGSGNGLGAYIDAGVEVLRTHHAHLAMGARLDAPFFSLSGSNSMNGGSSATLYYAPLSAEVRLTF